MDAAVCLNYKENTSRTNKIICHWHYQRCKLIKCECTTRILNGSTIIRYTVQTQEIKYLERQKVMNHKRGKITNKRT